MDHQRWWLNHSKLVYVPHNHNIMGFFMFFFFFYGIQSARNVVQFHGDFMWYSGDIVEI